MPKLRFKTCDYVCEGKDLGKGRGRGFRVYCRRTDKKCKPNGKPKPKQTYMKKRIETAAYETEMMLKDVPNGMTEKELEKALNHNRMVSAARATGMQISEFKKAQKEKQTIDLITRNEIQQGLSKLMAMEIVVGYYDKGRIFIHSSQRKAKGKKFTTTKVMEKLHTIGKPIRAYDLFQAFHLRLTLTDVKEALEAWIRRGDLVKTTDKHPLYSIRKR